MADISKLRQLVSGIPKTVDLTATGNVLNAENFKITDAGVTASKPLKLDGDKKFTSGDIDLTSEVTGALPYANMNIGDGDLTIAKTSGLQTALDGKQETSEKDANNGYCGLDAGGKVPAANLPSSVMDFQGSFDPATATFTDAGGNAGDVWLATAAGSYDAGSGSITYAIGDWAVHNGSVFEKSLNSNAVVSVNGQTGVVTLTHDGFSDYEADEHYPALDEDDMASDSDTSVATQQSIKAYVDALTHDGFADFVANEHLPGIDEDDMASDSDAAVPTQQSVKAYVDALTHDGFADFVANEHLPAIDEDDMASDSDTSVPTQQSVKAYVDAQVGAADFLETKTNNTGGALVQGDVVHYAGSSITQKAGTGGNMDVYSIGIVDEAIANGNSGNVITKAGGISAGHSGLTAGYRVYVDPNSPGDVVDPTGFAGTERHICSVGWAISATEIIFDPPGVVFDVQKGIGYSDPFVMSLGVNINTTMFEFDSAASYVLKVKAGGISETELNASVAGTGLTGGAGSSLAIDFKDEDDMASDSETHAATQQSIKAYVDALTHDGFADYVANEHLPGIDEDDMSSDSDAHVPTQQSVKAYVDALSHDGFADYVANEHLPGIDEDDMSSDSDAHVPTQQSVKAYVDALSHDGFADYVANEHLPGIDEDDMSSDSDAHVPTQQSVKAYVDGAISTASPEDLDFEGVAGEAMAANTTFIVRKAISGETAGRYYKATSDEENSPGEYHAIGWVQVGGSAVSAGDTVTVNKFKKDIALASADSVIGSDATDNGKPIWLNKDGAFSLDPAAGIGGGDQYACVMVGVLSEYNAAATSEKILMECNLGNFTGIDIA